MFRLPSPNVRWRHYENWVENNTVVAPGGCRRLQRSLLFTVRPRLTLETFSGGFVKASPHPRLVPQITLKRHGVIPDNRVAPHGREISVERRRRTPPCGCTF